MKLYIYEHCPFCVMAKMIFVLKNYPVELIYLLYDDVQTPMQMVGRKLLPILGYNSNSFMPESQDIIKYIDHKVDHPRVISPVDSAISQWVNNLQRFIYRLTYPRWIKAPFPEFATDSAKKYFLQTKDPSGKGFVSDLADPALLQRAQKAVDILDDLLVIYPLLDYKRDLSISDFTLFAQLHSLSIVKGLTYGPHVEEWRRHASEICSIELHDELAN
ncbi:glutaredoxin 2 [Commensalibacter oyaizuii]|uniref:Glutaredoxin 2 n=1 Tax=Commensalibacter oyaizuii TaxID=3043873 RepID=A0ABT6PZ45_9PROT|nr:glutaredoxin 2 [Commensalibacter sp. TBRC 16381]MDI2089786.1 glutaredoxin 2 [Commensalibacter sp. TBRC 16381]